MKSSEKQGIFCILREVHKRYYRDFTKLEKSQQNEKQAVETKKRIDYNIITKGDAEEKRGFLGLWGRNWGNERQYKWVYDNIVRQQKTLEKTADCEIERTGLHSREFIDTIRYTLSAPHTVSMDDTVHVMNLVDGRSARVESVDGSFAPFTVHYTETAIVPAAVGTYRIVQEEGETIKMLVASVR